MSLSLWGKGVLQRAGEKGNARRRSGCQQQKASSRCRQLQEAPTAGAVAYTHCMALLCVVPYCRLLPIAYEFAPSLIIVSAGFDAAHGDPLGGCHVSPACFGHMTALLQPVAPLVSDQSSVL